MPEQQPHPHAPSEPAVEPLRLRHPTKEHPTWTEHNDLPAEGAWLYVASRVTLDTRSVQGAWLPADTKPLWAADIVSQHVGDHLACQDLVVLDQTGLSEPVDEDHYVPETRR